MKNLTDWLLNMVLDGWKPIRSGNGEFLYLERDGAYYQGPVMLLKDAVQIVEEPYFWWIVDRWRECTTPT